MPILPGSMVVMARAASGPWQSSMKRTERPARRWIGRTSCAVDMSGRTSPFGRPKCESSRTIAPRSLSSRTVGSIARSRVSSVTLAPSIGTLRSTRTSTLLPVRSSGRSSSVLKRLTSAKLAHSRGRVDHAVGEAPFIVVPADDANQFAFEHRRLEAVDGRARRRVHEVDRDHRLIGVIEDALEARCFRRCLEDLVDLVARGVALRREGQVDEADVGYRYTDRRAVELALQLRQHFADGAGGAS